MLAVLSLMLPAYGAVNDAPIVDRVVVYKGDRRMVLLAAGKEIKTYRIALGADPVGAKTQRGDHRTPEGIYLLDAKNPHSHYYKAFHISYPNADDIESAKELGVSPGGDVMLHGLPDGYGWIGKKHRLHDWTDGCIAVTNQQMDELWRLVPVGTTIEIKP